MRSQLIFRFFQYEFVLFVQNINQFLFHIYKYIVKSICFSPQSV